MQDGAVEVKKEPLERSKALEDPEAVAEILIEIRRPRLIIESIVKARAGPKRFEKSDIELFVEAAYEDADETADEITIEEIVIDSIIDKIAGEIEATIDKIAGEAANDNTAGERVDEFIVDPSSEAIPGRGTNRRRGRRRS